MNFAQVIDLVGLMGHLGSSEDELYYPELYPGLVPDRLNTSNNKGDRSFAQGFGIPRTSGLFLDVLVDASVHARDFTEFSNGLISGAGAGACEEQSFGIPTTRVHSSLPFSLSARASVLSPRSLGQGL